MFLSTGPWPLRSPQQRKVHCVSPDRERAPETERLFQSTAAPSALFAQPRGRCELLEKSTSPKKKPKTPSPSRLGQAPEIQNNSAESHQSLAVPSSPAAPSAFLPPLPVCE